MSLWETEQFLNHGSETERSLADSWELNGDLLFDPQILLDTIMVKGGEFAPLFANAATTYAMTRSWWERHRLTFQKWWEVVDDQYNPLWDKDEYEQHDEASIEQGSSSTRTADKSNTVADNAANLSAHDSATDQYRSKTVTDIDADTTKDQTHANTENTVSAYDQATGYSPHDNSEVKSAHVDSSNSLTTSVTKGENIHNGYKTQGTTELNKTDVVSEGTSNTAHETEGSKQHALHHWGNAGISTTAQKLMEQELRVRTFNLYDMMSDLYVDEMCVRVFL